MTEDTQAHAIATAHADAHRKAKRAAYANGVTPRTERRWRSPKTAHMGPMAKLLDYITNAQEPFRVLARVIADHLKRKKVNKLTREQVVARIRELHVEDSVQEGVDNANRARRGLRWRDRAVDSERDAAIDLELSALYLRAEEVGLTEDEVFGA